MARTLMQPPHDVALGAPRGVALGGAPLLVQRSDGDFIDAVLDEITSAEGRARLLATRAGARTQRQVLKLFQPIQRQHHLGFGGADSATAQQQDQGQAGGADHRKLRSITR